MRGWMVTTNTLPVFTSAQAIPTIRCEWMNESARLGMASSVVAESFAVRSFWATALKDRTFRYPGPGADAFPALEPTRTMANMTARTNPVRHFADRTRPSVIAAPPMGRMLPHLSRREEERSIRRLHMLCRPSTHGRHSVGEAGGAMVDRHDA